MCRKRQENKRASVPYRKEESGMLSSFFIKKPEQTVYNS